MIRVCPRCHGLTQNTFLCPRCGIQTNAAETAPTEIPALPPLPDSATFVGGLLTGLLISQGLTHALRHLAVAGVLAWGSPAAFWSGLASAATIHGIQAFALFVAGVFAGAGQSRPLVLGLVLGCVNALALIALNLAFWQPIDPVTIAALPIGHALIGAIAASVGGAIWRPAPGMPALAADAGPGQELLQTTLPDQPEIVLLEPFAWHQFLLGILVAGVGTLSARWLRDLIVMLGGGHGNEFQSPFVTWLIALLAQVLGGVIAGANSRNSAVHGFWTGMCAAGIVIAVPAMGLTDPAEAGAWLAGNLAMSGGPAASVAQAIQCLVVVLLGGCLGSIILPPRPLPRPLGPAAQ